MALFSKKDRAKQSAIKYSQSATNNSTAGLCDNMGFVYAENCKLLRTKINLMIPNKVEEEDGKKVRSAKIIGFTSALAGEGKTTSAINLAYTMAETGKKVCLIEADMRLPNIANRLSVDSLPGLSNLLSGQCEIKDVLKTYVSKKNVMFFVVPAGDVPPTPSELLDSKYMDRIIDAFSNTFDFIIIDLPPIGVVTDALVVSKYTDGMILVCRKDYCDKNSLRNAYEQLKLADTKLLGVIFNDSDANSTGGSTYNKKDRGRYYQAAAVDASNL